MNLDLHIHWQTLNLKTAFTVLQAVVSVLQIVKMTSRRTKRGASDDWHKYINICDPPYVMEKFINEYIGQFFYHELFSKGYCKGKA